MSFSDLEEMIFLHLSVQWFDSFTYDKFECPMKKFSFSKIRKTDQDLNMSAWFS